MDVEDLAELTASALYAAAALDHNKRDEAPWPPFDAIADQSKIPYRKQAERLLELNLVIVPVARLKAMEEAMVAMDAELKVVRRKSSKKAEAPV